MKTLLQTSLLFALLTGSISSAFAARQAAPGAVALNGDETPAQIQAAYARAIGDLAPNLIKPDGGPLRTFEATVHHAARPGAEAERAACCQAIAAALQAEAPAEAKAWMLKLVAFADRGEIVTVATKLLDDAEPLLRESARCALQRIPVPEAAAALRAALGNATDPKWQGALALALGARKDAASVPALANLLKQNHAAVLDAAIYALGNIASPDAAAALAGARSRLPQPLRNAATESWMKCAERSLKQGKATEAAAIYTQLYQPQEPRPIRLAALCGLLKSSSTGAAARILDLLAGDDADGRAIAAGFIPELPGAGLKQLATGMNRLPPATQVMVLAALAERGEKSALPEALAAAKSAEEPVRAAGISALARLGDAATVPFLVELMATGGSAGGTARDSLQRLDGAGVNEAIVGAVQQQADMDRRAALIGVLEARGASSAVPTLLQQALIENAAVRRAAMRALGRLAQAGDLPTMLKSLLVSAPGGDRDDAERAITAICNRTTDAGKATGPVLALYQGASPAEKAILLPVLGRLGGPKAFEEVKSALAGSDAALAKAAEAALANWPDADDAVEAELLSLAQRSQKSSEREAALRAYIRVISLPSGLPEPAKLAKFKKAMELATRDAERILVLERLVDIRHVEALRLSVQCLEQPTLTSRAGTTICELAKDRGLKDRNKAEFEQALNRIIEVCKDQAVVDRAKRRLAEK